MKAAAADRRMAWRHDPAKAEKRQISISIHQQPRNNIWLVARGGDGRLWRLWRNEKRKVAIGGWYGEKRRGGKREAASSAAHRCIYIAGKDQISLWKAKYHGLREAKIPSVTWYGSL